MNPRLVEAPETPTQHHTTHTKERTAMTPPRHDDNRRMYDLTVLRNGRRVQRDHEFSAYLDLTNGDTLDPHLRFAAIRDGRDPATTVGEYVLEIRERGRGGTPLMRYVTTRGLG